MMSVGGVVPNVYGECWRGTGGTKVFMVSGKSGTNVLTMNVGQTGTKVFIVSV